MTKFDSISTQNFQGLVDAFREAATRGGSGSVFLTEAFLSYEKGTPCCLQNFDRLDTANRRLLWQMLNATSAMKWAVFTQLSEDLLNSKKKQKNTVFSE